MEKDSLIYILDSNENSVKILKSFLEEEGYNNVKTFQNYEKGLEALKSEQDEKIVFVDLDESSFINDSILEGLKLASNKIIMTSTEYSTDYIIKSFRYGALDFLPKPILKNQLLSAIEKINSIKDGFDSFINAMFHSLILKIPFSNCFSRFSSAHSVIVIIKMSEINKCFLFIVTSINFLIFIQ